MYGMKPSVTYETLISSKTMTETGAALILPAFSFTSAKYKRGRFLVSLTKPTGNIAAVHLVINGDTTIADYTGITPDSNLIQGNFFSTQTMLLDLMIDWIKVGSDLIPNVHGIGYKISDSGTVLNFDISISKDSTHQITEITGLQIYNAADADLFGIGSKGLVYGLPID